MEILINDQKIGAGHPPYVIAELSANHNGDISRAFRTMDMAKQAGADAVKIQTYTPDTMTIQCDKPDFQITEGPWNGYNLYELYKEAQTPFEWHEAIFDYAKKIGITVFSTPYDETAVDLLERLQTPAYKVASFEAIDIPLIRYIAKTRKPMIISTGMANEQEISDALEAARSSGCDDIVLLHCISGYPSPIEQANLATIPDMAKRFNCLVGLSDHTLGTVVPVTAVALGICMIEKHVTLSRKDKGPDSEFSLEPNELKRLCQESRSAWDALGVAGYDRKPVEEQTAKFRRSIYFVQDVRAGEAITRYNIRRIRPGYGLPPKYYDDLLGKRVKANVARGTAVTWDLIDG